MELNPSAEMYLETIYVLSQRKGQVRSIDIAEHMHFSKPSVSRAVGLLKQEQYIHMDKDGSITLTEAGASLAQQIYERHTVLTQALVMLGVDPEIAAADACRIEHVISKESFASIKKHMERK